MATDLRQAPWDLGQMLLYSHVAAEKMEKGLSLVCLYYVFYAALWVPYTKASLSHLCELSAWLVETVFLIEKHWKIFDHVKKKTKVLCEWTTVYVPFYVLRCYWDQKMVYNFWKIVILWDFHEVNLWVLIVYSKFQLFHILFAKPFAFSFLFVLLLLLALHGVLDCCLTRSWGARERKIL